MGWAEICMIIWLVIKFLIPFVNRNGSYARIPIKDLVIGSWFEVALLLILLGFGGFWN